jgi:hypothetical protein
MNRTFYQCYNLTSDVVIHSENISDATNCFYGTSLDKNVYIPFTYSNGENTLTYNTFINIYSTDPSNRINGVLLMDIKTYDINLNDYTYSPESGDIVLTRYIGEGGDIETPNV